MEHFFSIHTEAHKIIVTWRLLIYLITAFLKFRL